MSDPTPAEIEATGIETLTVDYAGGSYTFPADPDDMDGGAFDALAVNQFGKALQGILSTDDWRRFKATSPTVRDYKALLNAWGEAVGVQTAGG